MGLHLSPERRALDALVRRQVFDVFVETGRPPLPLELAKASGECEQKVQEALLRLEKARILKLFPDRSDVLAAHPFSAIPTPFRVESRGRSWWGACAWCALSIPAALQSDAMVFTVCADCQRPINWTVKSGYVSGTSSVVHIAVPAAHWWDDVVFSCNTILAFDSEEHLASWCSVHRREQGAILSLNQTWGLSKSLYWDLLQSDWKQKTLEDLASAFARAGLHGRFWDLHS
jgi:Alkylmercury lyase